MASSNNTDELTPPPPSTNSAANANNSNNNNTEPPLNNNHPPPDASATGGVGSGNPSGGSGGGSALNSPLLNGEHIVLLSPSNNTTPADDDDHTNTAAAAASSNAVVTEEALTPSRRGNHHHDVGAYSPPPDSIQTEEFISLSPPPLSLKSDGHHPYHHHDDIISGGGGSIISGSQSLFSGNGGGGGGSAAIMEQQYLQSNHPNQQQQQQKQKRPPLPPRWAIGTTTTLPPHPNATLLGNEQQQHHHHHPLPPKQVGPLSHRRVLSTGDASIMSVLTDPDSGDVSPVPMPQLAAFTSSTGGGGGGGGIVGTTTTSTIPVPAVTRKRGVSWDTTQHQPTQFHTEEQAAFDTLGILQPILMDEGGGGIGIDIGVDGGDFPATRQQQQQYRQSPPLPPENILPLKSPTPLPRSTLSPVRTTTTNSPSRRAMLAKSKRSQNMTSITQFEDEANLAIMEALNMYNLEQSEILGGLQQKKQAKQEEKEEEKEEVEVDELMPNNEDRDEENDFLVGGGGGVPHHVVRPTPTHRKDVSAITLSDGLDRSERGGGDVSPLRPVAATFEDVAWHDEYDAQGRIDGTLVEERESKYIAKELGIDLNAGSEFGAAFSNTDGSDVASSPASSRKQMGQPASVSGSDRLSVPESQHSKETPVSKGSKGSKASRDAPPVTGLRHRRTGTRGAGVLSAAQELAAMATIDESDESEFSKGHRPKIPSDGHSIDNLLAGATLIFQQKERIEGGGTSSDDEHMSFIAEETSVDMENEADFPRDEETGDATSNAKKHKRTPTGLFGRPKKPTKLDIRLERQFRLKVWYQDLIAPRIPGFISAATHSFVFVMMPLLFVAIILYYACGNPLTGGKRKEELIESGEFQGSWSWWILFILRQFFILSCVKAGEVISIDVIALRTPIFVRVFGSFATLMFVQARGWPYVITFWGVFDILVLYGSNPFARHWMFWQELIGMCNDKNPAADFVHGSFYLRILLSMIFVGVITALKRLMLATFFGRRSFAHYGPELEKILAKMILVSQVAHLARRIEANVINVSNVLSSGYAYTMKADFTGLASDSDDMESSSPTHTRKSIGDNNSQASDSSPHGFGASLRQSVYGKKLISSLARKNIGMIEDMTRGQSSSKVEMMKMLEEWEEPDLQANAASKVSLKDILQFRQAMSMVSDTYPFSQSFGPASTRAVCVESADHIFDLLVSKTPNTAQKLPFETLSELAEGKDGELMRDKVKALIRLFRPDRKGFLTKLDFITSVDQVYRELRLYRANLSNSQQIDTSFHGLINILHYFVVILIVLIIMGFNNWESLLSMTTFFFSFSFMFGPASSKYFEGILMIFVRRPYEIGDKVAISDPEVDTNASGSSTWFVEKVSLYSTTVRFATTNEVATYSNGSLARLRIINAKRSPKAIVYVYNKFGSDVPYRLIQVFKASVENFVKARPREWAQLNGFRATRVNLEFNFIEYVIVLTHRELWQNIGPILQSKADLASFSLEVSKKLNLRYEQPPKPIHLSLDERHYDLDRMSVDLDSASSGLQQVREMFKRDDHDE